MYSLHVEDEYILNKPRKGKGAVHATSTKDTIVNNEALYSAYTKMTSYNTNDQWQADELNYQWQARIHFNWPMAIVYILIGK